MKSKTLNILAFSLMTTTIFGGGYFSKQATGKKIKIANTETLQAHFEKTDISTVALAEMRFFDNFSEKEFFESDLEKELNNTFNDFWKTMAPQMELQIGKKEFEKDKQEQYENFMGQCNEMKPIVLEILLKSSSFSQEGNQ